MRLSDLPYRKNGFCLFVPGVSVPLPLCDSAKAPMADQLSACRRNRSSRPAASKGELDPHTLRELRGLGYVEQR